MAAPSFVGVGAFASGNGAITVGLPTGWQQGDLLLLLCESANETVATPSGWTQISGSPQSAGTPGAAGGVRLTVFYKIAAVGESSVSVADSGNHTCGVMAACRGFNTDSPFNAIGAQVVNASSQTYDFPSVTTTASDCLMLYAIATDYDANSTTNFSNWLGVVGITEYVDQSVQTQAGGGLGLAAGVNTSSGNVGGQCQLAMVGSYYPAMTIAVSPVDTSPHGTLTQTESADASSATGSSTIAGSSTAPENIDSITGSGSVSTTAVLNITEVPDGLFTESSRAALSVTEASDSVSIIASVPVRAALSRTEASDTNSAAGTTTIRAAVSIPELPDTPSSSGVVGINSVAAITEGQDSVSFAGSLPISGGVNYTEWGDMLLATEAFHASAQINEEGEVNRFVNPTTFVAPSPVTSGMFGTSVSMDSAGTALVVGHLEGGTTNKGIVSVFDKVGEAWVQRGINLVAADGVNNDRFGTAICLSRDGNVLAVGAPYRNTGTVSDHGCVYIYDRNGDGWTQRGVALVPVNSSEFEYFGWSVSLNADGSVLVVGAGSWGTTYNKGGVYIYDRDGTGWTQRGSVLLAPDVVAWDYFGTSLALSADGSVLAVGSVYQYGPYANQGSVYIYDRNGTGWTQRGSILTAADAAVDDYFGSSLSLSSDGSVLAVGAYKWEGAVLLDAGGVYIFDRNGNGWTQHGPVLAPSDARNAGNFGASVSLNSAATSLSVGATNWDGSYQGAVYVFSASIASRDTSSSSGAVSIAGSSAATEAGDSAIIAASVSIPAALSVIEADDQFSASVSVKIAAALGAAEANDSVVSAGSLLVSGALAQIEESDILEKGLVLQAVEESDSVSATASAVAGAVAQPVESADQLAAAAFVDVLATVTLLEESDIVSAAGYSTVVGSGQGGEGNDLLAAGGVADLLGGVSVLEESDTALFRSITDDISIPYGSGRLNAEYVASKWEFIDLMRRICEDELGIVIEDLTDEELVEIARLVVGLYEKERL